MRGGAGRTRPGTSSPMPGARSGGTSRGPWRRASPGRPARSCRPRADPGTLGARRRARPSGRGAARARRGGAGHGCRDAAEVVRDGRAARLEGREDAPPAGAGGVLVAALDGEAARPGGGHGDVGDAVLRARVAAEDAEFRPLLCVDAGADGRRRAPGPGGCRRAAREALEVARRPASFVARDAPSSGGEVTPPRTRRQGGPVVGFGRHGGSGASVEDPPPLAGRAPGRRVRDAGGGRQDRLHPGRDRRGERRPPPA
jgi:hypothetical protein